MYLAMRSDHNVEEQLFFNYVVKAMYMQVVVHTSAAKPDPFFRV